MITPNDVVVDGLPEVHLGTDPLCFKLIFDSAKHKNCHDIDVHVVDGLGSHYKVDISRWGTKMRVSMVLDPSKMPEGIYRVMVSLGKTVFEACRFWFVR
jgi:hypothetical protein